MTLATMTEILSPSTDESTVYIPMDDSSEATRWQDVSGIGEVITDDDNTSDLHDLGLGGPDTKV